MFHTVSWEVPVGNVQVHAVVIRLYWLSSLLGPLPELPQVTSLISCLHPNPGGTQGSGPTMPFSGRSLACGSILLFSQPFPI